MNVAAAMEGAVVVDVVVVLLVAAIMAKNIYARFVLLQLWSSLMMMTMTMTMTLMIMMMMMMASMMKIIKKEEKSGGEKKVKEKR